MKQLKINRLSLIAILSMALLSSCSYTIYSVNDRPSLATAGGLLYALPRTEVEVGVTLTTFDTTNAIFSQYASEMIGVLDGIDRSRARVSKIWFRNVPDPRAYYYVVPRRISVDISKDHLLRSVGLPSTGLIVSEAQHPIFGDSKPSELPGIGYNLYDRTDTFYVKGDRPGHPSRFSSKPDVRPMRQRALDAAEELQEVQQELIKIERGEYNGVFSAEQTSRNYQRLIQRQKHLISLFVGEANRTTHTFKYIPKDEKTFIDSQSVVLFYYSPALGIVDSSAEGAVPVICTVICDNHARNAARFVKYRTEGKRAHIAGRRRCFKYRMPETAEVTVSCPYFSETCIVPVSQFGPTIDLPRRRFKASFDPSTGDLLYYNGRP